MSDREWFCEDCGFTKPVTNGAPIGTQKRCIACRGRARCCATIGAVIAGLRQITAESAAHHGTGAAVGQRVLIFRRPPR